MSKLTRHVIYEKHNQKIALTNIMSNLFDGCVLKLSDDRPESIFFIKNDVVLIEVQLMKSFSKNIYFYITLKVQEELRNVGFDFFTAMNITESWILIQLKLKSYCYTSYTDDRKPNFISLDKEWTLYTYKNITSENILTLPEELRAFHEKYYQFSPCPKP
jgi:hypothetical protein